MTQTRLKPRLGLSIEGDSDVLAWTTPKFCLFDLLRFIMLV